MKRKALSIFMMLLLVLSLLPATALSAAEIDSAELIDEENEALPAPEEAVLEEGAPSAELTGAGNITSVKLYASAPAVGGTPDYNVRVSRADDNPFTITNVEWYTSDTPVDISTKFEEGQKYRVFVTLTPNSGYSFSDSCSYKLNDSLAMSKTGKTGSSVIVSYSWDALTVNVIKNLALTITHPNAGATPSFVLQSKTKGWQQGEITWEKEGGYPPMAYTDKFIQRTNYIMRANVMALNGYRFDEKCQLTINGFKPFGGFNIDEKGLHFSHPFRCYNIPFTDVDLNAYYAEPVDWAYNNSPQITAGTDATHFSPNNPCTRAQVVTFLWRAMGEPAPKSTYSGFYDIDSMAYYNKAVCWAVEKGITSGTDQTHFSPNATCTRAQVVTFLWRTMGEPAPKSTTTSFKDVDKNSYYYKAVCWAVENGITSGTDSTHFSPKNPCTRAQVVTFLLRTIGQG